MADRLHSQICSRGSQPQPRSGGNVPQPSRPQNAGPATGTRPQQGTSRGGTTYTGVGEPMQIDRQKQKKFKCSNCGRFGHISRNCNKPQVTNKMTNQVRSMEVDTQPLMNDTPRPAPQKGKKKKQFVRAFLQDLGSDEKEFLVEELVKDMGN